jgi:large conductance mechanosensitive channel
MCKKKNPNKKGLWTEFKEFAIKGNAMALAVGTIIGAAFSTITKSLTDDIIMPIINIFLGGTDFSEMKIALPRMPWVDAKYADVLDEAGNIIGQEEVINYLTWGNFLSAVINFFILAIVVFLLVKGINKLADIGKKKKEEAPAAPPAPPAPSNEEVLLTEIRDLLKNK